MRKLTGLFIAAAVTGTIWLQLPNETARSLTAQTGRTASRSSNAYQETARSLMQKAQSEALRGNDASAKRFALQAGRFPATWSANELSPTQLLSQLQRGPSAPPQQLNLASIAGRQTATPAQSKPSNELVTRASGTSTNSSPTTIAGTGLVDSTSSPTAAGSTGEACQLIKRVDQYLVRAPAASGHPKAPARPLLDLPDFSATLGQATASAAAHDQVLERLDQPSSAPTGPTTNISDDELAKQLLAESRQLMRSGRFDDARATAIRANNLNARYDVFSDEPQVVLRDIDYISRTMALTESSQAKLGTLSPFEAAPEESLAEAYEVLQFTPENDHSQSVELVTNWSSSVTKVTQAESSAPSLIPLAANAHETQRSSLPLPSAQGVGVWVNNDAPLELPTVASN